MNVRNKVHHQSQAVGRVSPPSQNPCNHERHELRVTAAQICSLPSSSPMPSPHSLAVTNSVKIRPFSKISRRFH